MIIIILIDKEFMAIQYLMASSLVVPVECSRFKTNSKRIISVQWYLEGITHKVLGLKNRGLSRCNHINHINRIYSKCRSLIDYRIFILNK